MNLNIGSLLKKKWIKIPNLALINIMTIENFLNNWRNIKYSVDFSIKQWEDISMY